MALLSCLIAAAVGSGSLRAGLVDELTDLFPDSTAEQVGVDVFRIPSARGTIAGVHIIVNGLEKDQPLSLSGGPRGSRWHRLIDVPVEVNTGIDSRTEKLDGKTNPHVIRRAPMRVYDALQPVKRGIKADAETMAFRFEVPIEAGAKLGQRSWELTIGQGESKAKLTFGVEVMKPVVPKLGIKSLGFTNWWSVGNVASYHKVEKWSEGYWKLLEKYADLMARSRQNMILVPWSEFTVKEGEGWKINREPLRRFIKLFERRGVVWLEGGHLAGREGNDWMAKRFVLNITGTPINTPQGEKELAAIAGELNKVIKEEGWADRWMQHIADEPIDVNSADYALAAAQVKKLMPGIPIFEATMSKSLVGAVNAWCPQVHEFQHGKDWFAERQKAGDKVWGYTCLSPTGPWMNRCLDMERIRPALIPWAMVKFKMDGFLHWGLNYWQADPFTKSVVRHSDIADDSGSLPAGDTHVTYPGGSEVWSSTRLEAHRIGFEDAELLRVLAAKDQAKADSVIAKIVRGFDDYTKSAAEYREAKAELLRSL